MPEAHVPPLRPYQKQVVRAVLGAALEGRGGSYSVLIARQGGKNELSAQLELALLLAARRAGGEAIKCAPTFDPQCKVSLRRLWGLLRASGLGAGGIHAVARQEGANGIRLGQAGQRFLSAEPSAAVVGHTASRLLECDEAQDVPAEKWSKDFLPMGSTSNATVVYYGTAWDETCLLAQMAAQHSEQQRKDGVQRHFTFDWEEVARYNPAYAAYVAAERERLGEAHPLFQTQYLLKTLPGSGRLFSPAALDLLAGSHAPESGPTGAGIYVGGLDVGGEALGSGRDADWTILTVGRVTPAAPGALVQEPSCAVVRCYAWQGAGHHDLVAGLAGLVARWKLRRLVIDATGVGEGLGSALAASVGLKQGCEVVRLRLSQQEKSRLGFQLQAAAAGGRLAVYAGDAGDRERAECLRQAQLARRQLRPNGLMSFDVDPSAGHDDYVMGLALLVEAAAAVRPLVVQGRRGDGWEEPPRLRPDGGQQVQAPG